jgi:hypothetical protein
LKSVISRMMDYYSQGSNRLVFFFSEFLEVFLDQYITQFFLSEWNL